MHVDCGFVQGAKVSCSERSEADKTNMCLAFHEKKAGVLEQLLGRKMFIVQ